MASEQPSGKPAATGRKLSPDRRSSQPQPQIPSPLSNDGLELMRDSTADFPSLGHASLRRTIYPTPPEMQLLRFARNDEG